MSSTDIDSRRMHEEANRCLLHRRSIASRHVGHRYALDVPTMSESCVAHGSFITYNIWGASRTDSAVLSEKDTVLTQKKQSKDNESRLTKNISRSVRSTKKYSSSDKNDATCEWWTNYQWRRNGWTTMYLFFICLLSCATFCASDYVDCSHGLDMLGRTWPEGDIVVEYGKPLKIFCILNQTKVNEKYPDKNASNLSFYRNDKKMPRDFIEVINETTTMLYIEKPRPAIDMYVCKLRIKESPRRTEPVCLNSVAIGTAPEAPSEIDCKSNNWENLTCKWVPKHNFVQTKHAIAFKLPGRVGARTIHPCPEKYAHSMENKCMWDLTTDPIYRQPYPHFTIMMTIQNVLGNLSRNYDFNHYAAVIPARPVNVSVVNITTDSADVVWNVPFPMTSFPPGLHHKILVQNQWESSNEWKLINITTDMHEMHREHHLADLKYANTAYDIRIHLKSAVASDINWGEFASITFRTLSTLPGCPPKTDVGSFHIIEHIANRDVFLYWQTIPQTEQNGNNFMYLINVEDNNHKVLEQANTTSGYYQFKGLGNSNKYHFTISTVNEVGASRERTKIIIPTKEEMPPEPTLFTKIVFNPGAYELSWRPPIAVEDIMNYTIFSCEHNRDSSQCEGYLDWVHIPGNSTVHNMTGLNPEKTYQFAIALNTKRGSSGMVWASCTVIHNKAISKMKSVWINRIGSDYIEVGWKLDCSDRIGIVDGFIIYYCPIKSPHNTNCKIPKQNVTTEAHQMQRVIDNLIPYTTYMLSVAVLTKGGEGLQSDALYNTTLEAAPSTSPLNVTITEVTNTTMYITWALPQAMNGVLRYCEVYYNEHSIKVEEKKNDVKLTGLLAYKNYSVSVAACTVACSKKSPTIYKLTEIGVPGKIATPKVRFMNSSQVLITWDTPQNPAAPAAEYYQIEISHSNEIRNISGLEMQLPIPIDCKASGRDQAYKFRVRAVNAASNDTHLKGPWSDLGEGYCISDGPSFGVWVIIWVIGGVCMIAFLLCLWYTFKRIWLKCRAMQDVEVKLPPGLAPNMKLLQKVGEQHIRQSSADSSAQESVTSSLTAESHVGSDSGTEVDSMAVSPDKLLETLTTWEPIHSSLRQRSVTREPDLISDTVADSWKPYITVAKSGEPVHGETLSLVRPAPNLADNTIYTTSQHTWSSAGYISMPSSEELSNNPSPILRENAINAGSDSSNSSGSSNSSSSGSSSSSGFSAIGTVPKSIGTNFEKDDDVGIMAGTVDDALIPIKPKTKPTSDMYVTLASMEQMEKPKMAINICDVNKLNACVESNKKFELDKLTSQISMPEKATTTTTTTATTTATTTTTSKPYVQIGLIDTVLQKSFAQNTTEQPVQNNR
ncbi:cytokine receptor [Linepithema humile]|uniref:cytokine receptor n=1 Tax=Linepithema humile TaxID=83485 RepID=UPI00351DEB7A